MGKITDETREKARELRASGASYGQIAKELNIGSGTAHRLTSDIKPPEELPEEAEFLDNEQRFLGLLRSYGIKDASRVVSYASTQGENVYADLETLKRCLVEQGTPLGKVGPLIRHWAAIEQLPLPPKLATELTAESPAHTAKPERWTVINGRPSPDEEGEYPTFAQALKVAQLEHQPQQNQQGGDLVNMLLNQLNQSNQRIEGLIQSIQDGRFNELGRQIQSLAQGQRTESTYGVMGKFIDKVDSQMSGLRGDIRVGFDTMASMQRQPGGGPFGVPGRSPQDKSRLAAIGKAAVGAERRAAEIENMILGGGSPDFSRRKTATPAKPPQIISE